MGLEKEIIFLCLEKMWEYSRRNKNKTRRIFFLFCLVGRKSKKWIKYFTPCASFSYWVSSVGKKRQWRSGEALWHWLVWGCKHIMSGWAPKTSGVGETLAVQGAEREKSEENCLRLPLICAEPELPAANWKGKKKSVWMTGVTLGGWR